MSSSSQSYLTWIRSNNNNYGNVIHESQKYTIVRIDLDRHFWTDTITDLFSKLEVMVYPLKKLFTIQPIILKVGTK